MSDYRLYCFGESGNANKIALMLGLTQSNWKPVFVDFFKGEARTDAFRAEINETGEVPVLDHKGERLTQSGVILHYLVEQTGQFGGQNDDEKREIWRWILFDNHKFTSYFATLRSLVGLQKTGETPVTEFLRTRALAAFDIVEKHLSSRFFMVGDRLTIADISMVGYLYYTEETGIDRAGYPNIDAWTRRVAAMPGFSMPYDVMERCIPAA